MMRSRIRGLAGTILVGVFSLLGCGLGHEEQDIETEQHEAALTGDLGIPDDSRCSRQTQVTLDRAGVTMDTSESYWTCWIAKNVMQYLPGTRSERLDVAAAVTWWALSEGVLEYDNPRRPMLHSLCGTSQITGASSCTRMWQVGIAAAQVHDRSWTELSDEVKSIYGSHTIDTVIGWTTDRFATSDQKATITRDMRSNLAKSWALRNPALGFRIVYAKEVKPECLQGDKKGDCFVSYGRPSTESSRKYASSETRARAVIADLRSRIDSLY